MFKLLRRKPCIHEYKIVDFQRRVNLDMSVVQWYDLACKYCYKRRRASVYAYERLKDIGLLVDENNGGG